MDCYRAWPLCSISGASVANMLAEALSGLPINAAQASQTQQPDAQVLFDDVETTTQIGDETVLTADIPYAPPQEAPIVLAARAVSAGANVSTLPLVVAKKKTDFILKQCQEFTDHMDPGSAEHVVDPAQGLANYLKDHHKREIDPDAIQIALLEGPKYGELTAYGGKSIGHGFYGYDPKAGFLGKDQVVFSAAFGGKRYKVVMALVVQGADQANLSCPPEPRLIKVTTLSSPLINYKVTFHDLTGSAVGNTVGEGSNAAITLDTTVAGHGWYVDATRLNRA